jgi:hypothetical protein
MFIVHSNLGKEILLKLYTVMVASTFLYGCENRNLIKQEEGKIKETEMKAVRPIGGNTLYGNKTCEERTKDKS